MNWADSVSFFLQEPDSKQLQQQAEEYARMLAEAEHRLQQQRNEHRLEIMHFNQRLQLLQPQVCKQVIQSVGEVL